MLEIPLPVLKAVLHYEPATGVFTHIRSGRVAGATRPDGRIQISIKGKLYRAHRLAWLYVFGEMPAKEIDHINGNPTDNRITNLREATPIENKWNRRVVNKIGFKGVQRVHPNSYMATITIHKKRTYLGCFKTPEEAHAVYSSAAKQHFGAFACEGERVAS